MNLIGESFDSYVATQISLRQRLYGSSTTPVEGREQYLYNKQPFVKLVSSVDITADKLKTLGLPEGLANSGLAKTFVLFAGTSEFQGLNDGGQDTFNFRSGLNNNQSILGGSAYGLGGLEFGQVPMPGITSATVSYKNRGSLKIASINIKAYNKTQLNIIDALYLRLGYTVLLEWGWGANYLNNNGEVVPQIRKTLANGFLNGSLDSGNILPTISLGRENLSGNYDALYGKITNFNWSFNPDGTYDITVSLVSVGDIIESLTVNDVIGNGVAVSSDSFQTTFDEVKTQLENRLVKVGDIINIGGANVTIDESTKKSLYILYNLDNTPDRRFVNENGKFILNDDAVIALITRNTGLISQTPITGSNAGVVPINAGLNSLTYYLYKDIQLELDSNKAIAITKRVGKNTPVVSVLKDSNVTYACRIDWEGKSEANYYIKLRTLLRWIQNNLIYNNVNGDKKTKALKFDLNVSNNLIYKNKYSIASDYTKVITRNLNYPNLETISETDTIDLLELPADVEFTSDKNSNAGKLMNVFLNLTWLVETLKSNTDGEGNISLFSFLQAICQGINSSLGYVNSLDVVIDEETNTIKFVDDKPIPGILEDFNLNNNPTEFQVYAFSPSGDNLNGSFVRDFGIRTDVTNKLATTLAIGAQALNAVVTENATALQSWNEGLTDRTAKTKESATQTSTEKTAWDRYSEDVRTFVLLLKKYDAKTLSKEELDQFNNLNKNWQKFWSQTIAEQEKKASPSGVGFIPINLNLTMDGLAGMKIYQTFTIDSKFLPLNYPDKLQFLIKGISHNITKDSWTTEIESFSIPKDITQQDSISTSTPDTVEVENQISTVINQRFVLPIKGGQTRGQDCAGSGAYGASRKRKGKSEEGAHKGYDIEVPENGIVSVYAPISGKLVSSKPYRNIGPLYVNGRVQNQNNNVNQGFTIFGTGVYKGIVVDVFYLFPDENLLGQQVEVGQIVGRTISRMNYAIQSSGGNFYPTCMTPHVHYQVKINNQSVDPTPNKGLVYDETLYKA
jgi:murein DD-endopeptidase MepM/ murein hydrolase activator NlpD